MIPVMQTIFDEKGDCLAACVASMLELPLGQVPNFCGIFNQEWLPQANKWFNGFGWSALLLMLDGQLDIQKLFRQTEQVFIAGGTTSRGPWLHACVYRGMSLWHDPHPSGRGLTNVLDALILIPHSPLIHPR